MTIDLSLGLTHHWVYTYTCWGVIVWNICLHFLLILTAGQLWLFKRKLEQIPFCTCHNPNPKTRSPSQLLPTNKECACTGPEAELYKLDVLHSARAAHAQCKLQCTATKRCKYHGVRVFWAIYTKKQTHCLFCAFSSFLFLGKHMVFTAFCGRALCFGLHTHKPKNISVASLFGG